MNILARTYSFQGKYAQAEELLSQELAIRRRMSPEHPDTLDTMADLVLTYQALENFASSEALAREAVEADRKKRPDNWQRFFAEGLLGASLVGQKKYAEAEPLLLAGYRGMEAHQERIQVPDQFHLDRAREWIAHLYQSWGNRRRLPSGRRSDVAYIHIAPGCQGPPTAELALILSVCRTVGSSQFSCPPAHSFGLPEPRSR